MNPFERLTEKLNDKMLDAMSSAQDKQMRERDVVAAAPPPPPAPLSAEEMAAFAHKRERVRTWLFLPSVGILMVACASFYSGTIGIPATLFAIGFIFWVVANRTLVCPRCGASLMGKAQKKPTCTKCGVQLRPE